MEEEETEEASEFCLFCDLFLIARMFSVNHSEKTYWAFLLSLFRFFRIKVDAQPELRRSRVEFFGKSFFSQF